MELKADVYSAKQRDEISREFCRSKETCYLDHAGATLYSEEQIKSVWSDLAQNIYSNPHGRSLSSRSSADAVDLVRYKVLDCFETTSEEYSVIFTSGATHALKIIAETFDFNGGTLAYLEDNHTSVLGMRTFAPNVREIKVEEAFALLSSPYVTGSLTNTRNNANSMFVYPAQSNFAGRKYPLSWIKKVQNGQMDENALQNWFVTLDAASFVSTNRLDLNKYNPDFVTISFYKIFGYPTGLGALLVKRTSEHLLNKRYLGGGTVLMALSSENVMIPRPILNERFEDGTLPFLSIISVRHGFDTLKRLNLTFDVISQHTFHLARYLYFQLVSLHHCNGAPVAKLYHETGFEDRSYQGGIVNFNLRRPSGHIVGYAEVLHMCNLHGMHLRTGCFCNPGACQRHLKLSTSDIRKQFEAGHVCGDEHDLVNGFPTGSVRVSFGYMSTYEDVDRFLSMVENYFILKPVVRKPPPTFSTKTHFDGDLIDCGKISVDERTSAIPSKVSAIGQTLQNGKIVNTSDIYKEPWKLTELGLKYDRQWMVVGPSGTCITQKQIKRLCLIKPELDINRNKLKITFRDENQIEIPLDLSESDLKEAYFCKSKVCSDQVQGYDCGDNVSEWLSAMLDYPGLRLLRQCEFNNEISGRKCKRGEARMSLANEAQFLLVNLASVQWLKGRIPGDEQREQTLESLVLRFRPNLVVAFDEPFAEISLKIFRIGDIAFKFLRECTRCQMICIDQQTGETSKEPLQTLSREFQGKIRFGVYLNQESPTASNVLEPGCTVFGTP
ncbi:molybdenum cofactor sulfurase 3 isoform X2 [Cylas formicarius]|uniref:molybdenum cofactor sulfurase 3 isoform X2 n=1 Tax=Cylas formicarius TaxID=197179 RepID=UPI0029588092|nr:molybdenum cofactor sulfurase 3 isoform X2 [Cylas formicarius]